MNDVVTYQSGSVTEDVAISVPVVPDGSRWFPPSPPLTGSYPALPMSALWRIMAVEPGGSVVAGYTHTHTYTHV